MANYCSNHIAWYGSQKEAVDNFRKLMIESFNENKRGSVRDFVIKMGYSKEEASALTDSRDVIICIDDELSEKEGIHYFVFQTETAWTPNIEVFSKILNDKYPSDYGLEYVSEEPGVGIYINSDIDGFFFVDRYHIDSCIKGDYQTSYLESKAEVLCWIKNRFPKANVSLEDSIDEIEVEVRKYIDENSDDYFSLYEFKNH